ncbi:MAG: hypothetical protein IPH76_07155 [Xanthomonadales bacterium]|nr:hypothetical protein [Xanthomonadales bacterium]
MFCRAKPWALLDVEVTPLNPPASVPVAEVQRHAGAGQRDLGHIQRAKAGASDVGGCVADVEAAQAVLVAGGGIERQRDAGTAQHRPRHRAPGSSAAADRGDAGECAQRLRRGLADHALVVLEHGGHAVVAVGEVQRVGRGVGAGNGRERGRGTRLRADIAAGAGGADGVVVDQPDQFSSGEGEGDHPRCRRR